MRPNFGIQAGTGLDWDSLPIGLADTLSTQTSNLGFDSIELFLFISQTFHREIGNF